MALAAHDLLLRCSEDDMHQRGKLYVAMLQCKLQSIKYAQSLLSRRDGTPDDETRGMNQGELDCLLLITTLQSLLETVSDTNGGWMTHLLGGLLLLRQHGESPFTPAVHRFATDHLSLYEVFLSSTGVKVGVEPLDGWLVVQRQAVSPILRSKHGRSQINPCTGISSELVTIIACITAALRHDVGFEPTRPRDLTFEGLQEELQYLEERLTSLTQWSEDPDQDSIICLNAAAFETAAWVYLRLAQAPAHDAQIQSELIPKLLNCIEKIHERQGDLLGSLPYPMWALFIAACAAPEDERARTLDCFSQLTHACSSSNILSVSDAVMHIWKQRDMGLVGVYTAKRVTALSWQGMIQDLKLKAAFIV